MALMKTIPEDFVVKEIHNHLEFKPKAKYAYFILFKKSYNTVDACQKIANDLGINLNNIKFAGSKDKQAVTFQLISIPSELAKKEYKYITDDLKVSFLGYKNDPLSLGKLDENEFQITVRNCPEKVEYNESEFYIPNYFDEQRFSIYNSLIGKCIVKKNFKRAVEYLLKSHLMPINKEVETLSLQKILDLFDESDHSRLSFDLKKDVSVKTKKIIDHLKSKQNDFVGALRFIPKSNLLLIVNSYQSDFFNKILNEIMTEFFKETSQIEVNKTKLEIKPIKEKTDNYKIPLIGFSTSLKYKEGYVNKFLMNLLAEENISFRDFIVREIPTLTQSGSERDAFLKVRNFKTKTIDKKTKQFSFTLPKGAYATMVMKTIFAMHKVPLHIHSELKESLKKA